MPTSLAARSARLILLGVAPLSLLALALGPSRPEVSPGGRMRAPNPEFAPQVRLGFTEGDQWEPAIAADEEGHVYVLYAQYLSVPGCPSCASPTAILQTSSDGGATWSPPRLISPAGSSDGQWDPQIVVDPLDGRTVYAAWLEEGKSDVMVARSEDFGASWSVVQASHLRSGADKPILVVRGPDVYVAYNHAQKIWVSASHDGATSFVSRTLPKTGRLGWALASGAAIDPAGMVAFAWAGYEQSGNARGPVNLFLSRSFDGGETWDLTVLDTSGEPPDCSAYLCGWAYLGAQIALAVDDEGSLYALWNSSQVDRGPARMYFARSDDEGAGWTPRQEISLAPSGADHAFPAVAAGATGDVRMAWMDDRADEAWNTYYRSSSDGGSTWSEETDLSTFVPGFAYITAEGFSFPFGDYFELDIGQAGATHAVWGEGLNYNSPGSIWYTTGR